MQRIPGHVQDFIYIKSRYMQARAPCACTFSVQQVNPGVDNCEQACMDAGIPMAPTIFAIKGKRSPAKLLAEIKERGEGSNSRVSQ